MKEADLRAELLALMRGEDIPDSRGKRKKKCAVQQDSAKRLQSVPWHSASENDDQTATREYRSSGKSISGNVNVLTKKKKKTKAKEDGDSGASRTEPRDAAQSSTSPSVGNIMTGHMADGRRRLRESQLTVVGAEKKLSNRDAKVALGSTSSTIVREKKSSSQDASECLKDISAMKKKRRKNSSATLAVDQNEKNALDKILTVQKNNVSALKRKKRKKPSATHAVDQKQEHELKKILTVQENNVSAIKSKKRKNLSARPVVNQKQQDELKKMVTAPENNVLALKSRKRKKSSATLAVYQKQHDESKMISTVQQNNVSVMKRKKRKKSSAQLAVDQKQQDELEKVLIAPERNVSSIKRKGFLTTSAVDQTQEDKLDLTPSSFDQSVSVMKRRKLSVTQSYHKTQVVKLDAAPTTPKQSVFTGKKRRMASSIEERVEENQREMHAPADSETHMSAIGSDKLDCISLSKNKKRRKNGAANMSLDPAGANQNQSRPLALSETTIVASDGIHKKNHAVSCQVTAGTSNDVATATVPAKSVINGRLAGARFRDLNESLYAGLSRDAFQQFSKEPDLFDQYHDGFRRQTDMWPESPLELISALLLRPAFAKAQVADLGCGEAKLAKALGYERVASFDLIEDKARKIQKCNINSSVPLPAESKDVVVLCLALMGQDCAGALREAWRILRPKGLLLVAEVTSRFDSPESFAKQLSLLGFKLLNFKDFGPKPGNTHFFLLPFQKYGRQPDKTLVLDAKVCKYKRR